jgi:hypothetical protein
MSVIKIVPMPGAKGDKGDDGATGAQGLQGPIGETGPAGADALWNYNGEWESNATYAEGDLVTHDGQLYYATGITTLGVTPDLDSNFDLIAAKGADGIIGVDGAQGPQGLQGEQGIQGQIGFPGFLYDPRRAFENQYTIGEIVYYGGQYWQCQNNNDAIVPGTDPAYWLPYSFVGPQGPQGEQGIQGPSAGISYKEGVPANPTATGQVGQLSIDGVNGVLYVCTGTNTWQKVSLNSANFTNPGGFV